MNDDQTLLPATDPGADPAAQPVVATQGDDTANASDPSARSPLDILEELLKKNQGAGAAGKSAGGAPSEDGADAAAPDEAAAAAAEEAEKQRIAQAMAAKEAEEAILVQQKLVELKNVVETPQEQERLRQVEEQQQTKTDHASDQDGFVIHQLGHTKV
jgi:hypothetical protein